MSIVKDLLLISIFLFVVIKYIRLSNEYLKLKDNCLKFLTHDLRVASIAQIRGLELLEKFSDLSENEELVKNISESCKYTLEMITTFINTLRYSQGENVLNIENFQFSTLYKTVTEDLSLQLSNKNIVIKKINDKDISISADKQELEKTLKILLSTAILYSEKNSKIFFNLQKTNRENIIIINYRGKTLTEEEYNRMFNNKSRFSTVGLGVKLHYCKKIIDFHKGNIKINCDNKKNNFFTITLPDKTPANVRKTALLSRIQPNF